MELKTHRSSNTSGSKIHITGQNGIGKSTLLKAIHAQNNQPCDSIHLSVECFYLDQNFSFYAMK